MNGLPKEGKNLASNNPFIDAKSGRVQRKLAEQLPVIPLCAKDRSWMAEFEGYENFARHNLIKKIDNRIALQSDSIDAIKKGAEEFFEMRFFVNSGKSVDRIDHQGDYKRKLSILEALYGKNVYKGIEISSSTDVEQLKQIYEDAIVFIANGKI